MGNLTRLNFYVLIKFDILEFKDIAILYYLKF